MGWNDRVSLGSCTNSETEVLADAWVPIFLSILLGEKSMFNAEHCWIYLRIFYKKRGILYERIVAQGALKAYIHIWGSGTKYS